MAACIPGKYEPNIQEFLDDQILAAESLCDAIGLHETGTNLIEYVFGITGKMLVIEILARDPLNSEFEVRIVTDGTHGVDVDIISAGIRRQRILDELKSCANEYTTGLTAIGPIVNTLSAIVDKNIIASVVPNGKLVWSHKSDSIPTCDDEVKFITTCDVDVKSIDLVNLILSMVFDITRIGPDELPVICKRDKADERYISIINQISDRKLSFAPNNIHHAGESNRDIPLKHLPWVVSASVHLDSASEINGFDYDTYVNKCEYDDEMTKLVNNLKMGDIVVFSSSYMINEPGDLVRIGRVGRILDSDDKSKISLYVPMGQELAPVRLYKSFLSKSIITVLKSDTVTITPDAIFYFDYASYVAGDYVASGGAYGYDIALNSYDMYGTKFICNDKNDANICMRRVIKDFIIDGFRQASRYTVMNNILEYVSSKIGANVTNACIVDDSHITNRIYGHAIANIIDIQKTDIAEMTNTDDSKVKYSDIKIRGNTIKYGDIVVYRSNWENLGSGDVIRVGRIVKADTPRFIRIKTPSGIMNDAIAQEEIDTSYKYDINEFAEQMFIQHYPKDAIVITQFHAFLREYKDMILPAKISEMVKLLCISQEMLEYEGPTTHDLVEAIAKHYRIKVDRKDIYLVSEGAGRRITEIDEPFLMPNHVIRDDEVTPKPKEIIRYIPEHSFKIQSREDY